MYSDLVNRPVSIQHPIIIIAGWCNVYRKLVVSSVNYTNGAIDILYHVRGAVLVSQRRVMDASYDSSLLNTAELCAAVFADSIRLNTKASVTPYKFYEFILNVSENQPVAESVEEISTIGVTINVYNESGVLVCTYTGTPASGNPPQTNAPGEMTSVPGEEPGAMI